MGKASELGSSLLASKQRRDDSFRKDREKWEKRQAFISLAAPAIQTGMAEYAKRKDTDLLFSNPEVMEVASNFKIAGRNSETLAATEAAIALSGKSPEEYHYNLYKDDFRASAIAEIESRNDYQATAIGDAGPFNKLIAAETRSLTDEIADRYKEAITSARNIGSDEDRAALLTDLTTSINPRRISGHIIKRARGLFGRRSQEELDEAAIEALRNSTIAENVANFNGFIKAYDESKNIYDAFDFAALDAIPEADLESIERLVSTVFRKQIGVKDRLVIQKVETYENRNTGTTREKVFPPKNFFYGIEESNEEKEAKTLKSMKDDVDIFKMVENYGTPNALNLFVERASADELRYMNPSTVAEYNQLQTIAETMFNENPSLYLKDEFENATTLQLMNQLGNTGLTVQTMISQFSDDPDEQLAAELKIEEYLLQFRNFSRSFNDADSPTEAY